MSIATGFGSHWSRTGIGTWQNQTFTSILLDFASARCQVTFIRLPDFIGMVLKSETRKRTREEAVPHRTMGPRQHSHRPIQGGEMIIEYLGEWIRRSVCDAREAHYRAENKDCYFFTLNDEFVLDATRKGNVAWVINHSCQPNCYARIVVGNGTNRIVFVAKEDIPPGQELTFDYMFNTDDSDENRVLCRCQAPNCRGYMA